MNKHRFTNNSYMIWQSFFPSLQSISRLVIVQQIVCSISVKCISEVLKHIHFQSFVEYFNLYISKISIVKSSEMELVNC